MSEAGNPRSRRNARTGQVADLLDDAPEDVRNLIDKRAEISVPSHFEASRTRAHQARHENRRDWMDATTFRKFDR